DAASFLRRDGVGLQARAVVHIHHLHLLVRQDARRLQQFGIDGDGAFVVQIGLGNAQRMKLRFKHRNGHSLVWGRSVDNGQAAGTCTRVLAMRRVFTKDTASAAITSCPGTMLVSGWIVSVSTTTAYWTFASGAFASSRRIVSTIAPGCCSPSKSCARAAVTACESTTACARSSAFRYRLRDESASPSGSRTVGTPTSSMPKL